MRGSRRRLYRTAPTLIKQPSGGMTLLAWPSEGPMSRAIRHYRLWNGRVVRDSDTKNDISRGRVVSMHGIRFAAVAERGRVPSA